MYLTFYSSCFRHCPVALSQDCFTHWHDQVLNYLKFHEHTNLTITKANRVLGLIRKTFYCREPDMITKLFKSLIRPILEYGNLIWGPHYVADQQAIEGVQQRATKLISSISHCPYPEKLRILNLPSLNYRRLRGDMMFCIKSLTIIQIHLYLIYFNLH